jgi:hypothetical protein
MTQIAANLDPIQDFMPVTPAFYDNRFVFSPSEDKN